MVDKDSMPAFELLLEHIDNLISDLNKIGAEFIMTSKHSDVRQILSKVEYVKGYKEQIISLRNEWPNILTILADNSDSKSTLPHDSENNNIIKYNENVEQKSGVENGYKVLTLKESVNKNNEVYNINYHLRGKSSKSIDYFQNLRDKIKGLSRNVQEKSGKMYIAYYDPNKFCEIHMQTQQLKIWIVPPIENLDDPSNLCRDVRHIGHYGTGSTEIILNRFGDLEKAFSLIKQSYKYSRSY